jgi:hypothetical protein
MIELSIWSIFVFDPFAHHEETNRTYVPPMLARISPTSKFSPPAATTARINAVNPKRQRQIRWTGWSTLKTPLLHQMMTKALKFSQRGGILRNESKPTKVALFWNDETVHPSPYHKVWDVTANVTRNDTGIADIATRSDKPTRAKVVVSLSGARHMSQQSHKMIWRQTITIVRISKKDIESFAFVTENHVQGRENGKKTRLERVRSW